MGGLSIRAEREAGAEPGFPPIGRECDACGHRDLTDKPSTARCAHDGERERVYKRTPRPSSQREPHAWRCMKCKRILDKA